MAGPQQARAGDDAHRAAGAELCEETHWVSTGDGQRLALTEIHRGESAPRGTGPTFLLLHGFAQNRLAYTLGAMPEALLDRGARVFLGELRGHGDSTVRRDAVWKMEHHLEADAPALLEGVRAHAASDDVHLVGHSMGGLIGAALLGRGERFASFTAAATPLLLGAGRPLVRAASFAVGPFATIAPRFDRVPMDLFLRSLSRPLAAKGPGAMLRGLQRLTRLANPELADPEALRTILAHADRESPAVMEELAKCAVLGRSELCGVDLARAVREATCPIAAIVGTRDIFAPRAAIAPLEAEGQQGPRAIVEIDGGTHVDAVMGHHVRDTVAALWPFWVQ